MRIPIYIVKVHAATLGSDLSYKYKKTVMATPPAKRQKRELVQGKTMQLAS